MYRFFKWTRKQVQAAACAGVMIVAAATPAHALTINGNTWIPSWLSLKASICWEYGISLGDSACD